MSKRRKKERRAREDASKHNEALQQAARRALGLDRREPEHASPQDHKAGNEEGSNG